MHNIRWSAALALSIALSGCAAVRNGINADLKHPGGLVGYAADKYNYYPATTKGAAPDEGAKKLILYRSIVTFTFLSRVGQSIIQDDKSAEAFIQYQTAVADDINKLAGHLYGTDDTTMATCRQLVGEGCKNYPQLFESDLPPLEEHLLRLGVAALPKQEASAFMSAALKGSVLGAVNALWKLARGSLLAAHSAAAVRRSEREIMATMVCDGPIDSVTDAVRCVADHQQPFKPQSWSASADSATPAHPRMIDDETAAAGKIGARTVAPFYLLIREACWQLPLSVPAGQSDDARQKRGAVCANIKWAPQWDRYFNAAISANAPAQKPANGQTDTTAK